MTVKSKCYFIWGLVLFTCSCYSRKYPGECTMVIGQVLFSSTELCFGEVGLGEVRYVELKVYNPTREEVRVRLFNRLVELSMLREGKDSIVQEEFVLLPRNSRVCRFRFMANDTSLIGHYSKNIFFEMNGELYLKPVRVNADVCDSKSGVWGEELLPEIELECDTLLLGVIVSDKIVSNVINVKNSGKKDLIIRKIETDCTCTVSILKERVIAPGKSVPLTVEFKPLGRKGKQYKMVKVFSNDVRQPVVKLIVSGYVE